MDRPRHIAVTLLAIVPALLIGGAKPAPAPTSFVPEVAYRYASNTAQDLRLGDATGSAAILLHRSTVHLSQFDLAPRSARAAVLIELTGLPSSRLVLRTWTQDPTTGVITVDPPRTLHEARTLLNPDFSPDGTQVAFGEWEGVGLYSLRVVDVATGVVKTIATGVDGPAYLRWSSTGENLYYVVQNAGDGLEDIAYRQPVAGGSPVAMFGRPNIERWDISRDASDSLILNYSPPETGQGIPFARWDGTTLTNVYPQLIGGEPHYACGNTRMIYLSFGKGGAVGPLKVFTPATGADVVYTRDQGARVADWIPCG